MIRSIQGILDADDSQGASLADIFRTEVLVYSFGCFAIAASAAPGLAPVIAGFAIEATGDWRWAFWEMFFLSLFALVFLSVSLPEVSHGLGNTGYNTLRYAWAELIVRRPTPRPSCTDEHDDSAASPVTQISTQRPNSNTRTESPPKSYARHFCDRSHSHLPSPLLPLSTSTSVSSTLPSTHSSSPSSSSLANRGTVGVSVSALYHSSPSPSVRLSVSSGTAYTTSGSSHLNTVEQEVESDLNFDSTWLFLVVSSCLCQFSGSHGDPTDRIGSTLVSPSPFLVLHAIGCSCLRCCTYPTPTLGMLQVLLRAMTLCDQ